MEDAQAKSSNMNSPLLQPARPQPESQSAYRAFRRIATRWSDNDVYGHVNNVVYYNWFDSAVNGLLIEEGALDIHTGSVIGLVVESHCNYFMPLAFPDDVVIGIRVALVGSTSVRYELGVFSSDTNLPSAAKGYFVHAYVDRISRKPTALSATFTNLLETLK